MPRARFLLVIYCITFLTAGMSDAAPPPAPAANCPVMCGNVSIPYPFGIGAKCSLPGSDDFTVTCNDSRPYIGNILVVNITLETAEMLVMAPTVTFQCVIPPQRINSSMNVNLATTYRISPTRNLFTAVGCGAMAKVFGSSNENGQYLTGCVTYCANVSAAAENGTTCMGLGCCEAAITPGLTHVSVSWEAPNAGDQLWRYNPCQYAFVAEKGWYNFSRNDLTGTLRNQRNNWSVPLVLDWAIRNESCPPDAKHDVPYGACVSAHSDCVNASGGMPGYFCNCSNGYAGNPYERDGCKNINECENQNPCHGGTCHDVDGDYECKCNFGRRGDGKSQKGCQPILPLAAVVVIGSVVLVSFLVVLLMFIHMEHQKRKLRDLFNRNGGQLLKSIKMDIFTKQMMDQITKNYSTIIGKGGFGEVYMGTTNENVQVAVKRSIAINEARQKDFANEVTIQSQISHKHLVRLLGCCLETDVPMLVYEFIPRGSLYDVLHGNRDTASENDTERHPLSLRARLDIAIYSADALAYMHTYASQKVLHGDVKSGNILLDDNFMPKVSDFGTSRLLSIEKAHTNFVIGDMSYIDPVYMKTGLLTEKSDVYSFGVVLLELITGKKARYDGNNSLQINFVKAYMTESRAKDMYDKEIISTEEDMNCLEKVGGIAVECLKDDVNERPTMIEVVKDLQTVRSEWLQSHDQM